MGKNKGKQFNIEKRVTLDRLLSKDNTAKSIASVLGMDATSISREIKRNRVQRREAVTDWTDIVKVDTLAQKFNQWFCIIKQGGATCITQESKILKQQNVFLTVKSLNKKWLSFQLVEVKHD